MTIPPLRATSVAILIACVACGSPDKKPAPASAAATVSSADSSFTALAKSIIDDRMRRYPSAATDLGVHQYDDRIEDASAAAVQAESKAFQDFRARLVAVDTTPLSVVNRADREQLILAMDAGILADDVIKRWTKDADAYSGGITNAAYVIMKRPFAPAPDRLRSLIARERLMPAVLQEARKNLATPPHIYTQIAIEQIDGNVSFFRNDVPAAFADVKDSTLLAEFKAANDSVVAALTAYKGWLQKELLPKSTGSYAYGADTYRKALAANEMIDLPIDRLLQIAEADRQKNEAAFQAVARQIDSTKPADRVLASLQADHPRPTNCWRRRRPCSTRCGSFSSTNTSSRFPPPTPRA